MHFVRTCLFARGRSPASKHYYRAVFGLPHLLVVVGAILSTGASYRTQNFIVTADDAESARRVALAAEELRRSFSEQWLGADLPAWRDACPIRVHESDAAKPNGNTSFVFVRGEPTEWRMSIQGGRKTILDSVLPHEIAHTVFATYFGRPLPRWVEEGICVTVENELSQSALERLVVDTVRRGHVLNVERLFAITEYPRDVLPFYSQGYSLTRFLIESGGEKKLIDFINEGMASDDWSGATRKIYGYQSLAHLQRAWTAWVLQTGSRRQTEQASFAALSRSTSKE